MIAFWALVLLFAFGCLHAGGLVDVFDGWFGVQPPLIDPFPVLGTLKTTTLGALGVLVVLAWITHRILNKPKIADTLIETEAELHKVTWPTWGEAWHGTMAVTVMVLILFVFLTLVDASVLEVMMMLIGGSA